MNSHNIIIVGALFIVACSPHDALPLDHTNGNSQTRQMRIDEDISQACLDLQNAFNDKDRSQVLLRDRTRIHGMLELPEVRQKMLQHPGFMRQMMQIGEIRRELLQNEQMMHEMLRNRDVHREIDRNLEMMKEIEKNETYRHINQEQEAGILEDLLLESTDSKATSSSNGTHPH